MGRDPLAMVFLKDKTLTRDFPDIRAQGIVFVIVFFACPTPIYDKDQVFGVAAGQVGQVGQAGQGRRISSEAGSQERTLLEEQPSVHSGPFSTGESSTP